MRSTTWLAALAALTAGCGGDDSAGKAEVRREPPPGNVVKVRVGGGPGYATFAFGSVWVANHQSDSVVAVEPSTNKVRATIEVPGEPTGISAGFGSLWTFTPIGGGKVRRLDPKSERLIASIPVKSPGGSLGGLAQAAGAMWLAGDDGWLTRIDPRSERAERVLRLPATDVPCAGTLAAAAGDLWLAWECGGDRLVRIDPRARRVTDRIRVPDDDYAVWVTAAGRRLWALTQGGRVLEIDTRSASILRSGQVADSGAGMAYGSGALWVRATADELVRVDPETLRPNRTDKLPAAPVPGGGLALGAGAVWAANFSEGTVYRLEP